MGNLSVQQAQTTITIRSDWPNPSSIGQQVTLTAAVTVDSPGSTAAAVPTGPVTFYDGEAVLGDPITLPADGTATLTISTLSLGGHTITAVYSGDANFLGGVSTADSHTVNIAPAVLGISPSAGPTTGNTSVTITGLNLSNALGVAFGGVPATISSNTDTTLVVTSPAAAGAGIVDVTVTTAGGASNTSNADRFTYVTPPSVAAIRPATGYMAGGTQVTIAGTNFTGATVQFGDQPATIVSSTDTTLVVTSPAASAGIVDVIVTTLGGPSASSSADQFTYTGVKAAPTFTVADAGGTYNGSTFPATAKVAGVVTGFDTTPSDSLEGVSPTVTYYVGSTASGTGSSTAPSAAGTYTVVASFAGSTDYAAAQSSPVNFTIAQATPVVTATAAGGTYNGSPFPATATVAAARPAARARPRPRAPRAHTPRSHRSQAAPITRPPRAAR